jgi:hypothetical protein
VEERKEKRKRSRGETAMSDLIFGSMALCGWLVERLRQRATGSKRMMMTDDERMVNAHTPHPRTPTLKQRSLAFARCRTWPAFICCVARGMRGWSNRRFFIRR